jgi:hypothetical protein
MTKAKGLSDKKGLCSTIYSKKQNDYFKKSY